MKPTAEHKAPTSNYQPDMPGVAPLDYAQEVADKLGAEVAADIPAGWHHAIILYCDATPRDSELEPTIALYAHAATLPGDAEDAEDRRRVLVMACRLLLERLAPGQLESDLAAHAAVLEALDRIDDHKRSCAVCHNNLARASHDRRPCTSMAGLISNSLRLRDHCSIPQSGSGSAH